MITYRDSLIAFAVDQGVDPEAYLDEVLASHMHPEVPERYRRLVAEVLWRLPAEWDAAREWSITASPDPESRGYACVNQHEQSPGDITQSWFMTLYPKLLDRLSDPACRYVIAHEFGHIASGLPSGSIVIKGIAYTLVPDTVDQYEEAPSKDDQEDVAETIALDWGFSCELQRFLMDEDALPS